ncbi:hypothetical protein HBJ33_028765 (plasmid) [Klebsiella pneumoniae]|nr:hypothetical protein HBJ33_028765 [Klebsiella pneumoniae]
MAKGLRAELKQRTNAIEASDRKNSRGTRKLSRGVEIKREKMSAAIAEHSQKMGWLLLKTWIWMLVSIVPVLERNRQDPLVSGN